LDGQPIGHTMEVLEWPKEIDKGLPAPRPLPQTVTRITDNRKTLDELVLFLNDKKIPAEKRDGDYFLRGRPATAKKILEVANSHRRQAGLRPFILIVGAAQ